MTTDAATRTAGGPTAAHGQEYATDEELLARVLAPYKEHCRYVRSATVGLRSGHILARCEFAVPESCYIDDTGHLNSVEVIICFNQMMYYMVAKAVKERLGDAFGTWTLDDAWDSESRAGSAEPELRLGQVRADNVLNGLRGSGIVCPPIDRDLMIRYLDHCVATGSLPAPAPERRHISTSAR